ncbi:hypothetical protein KFE94_04925 [bacterium SCSIO 12643]|nr:hypothetical protein KFE94_04925 [bacterium SCSIO 12643]
MFSLNHIANTINVRKVIYTLLVLSFFLLQNCKCDNPNDPSCPNYDPCLCVSGNFADFKMEERIMEFDMGQFVETENTIEGNTIYFSILDENVDSVHWTIGTDPRIRREKKLEIYFKEAFGDVKIRCIAYKNSVAKCLGNEAIIDTVYKTLKVRKWWDVPYLGKYQGESNLNPNEVFITDIDTLTYYAGMGYNQRLPVAFLTNFPSGYQMPVPPDGINIPNRPVTRFSYNGFVTSDAYELGTTVAIFNSKLNTLNIEYEFLIDNKYQRFTYSGIEQD